MSDLIARLRGIYGHGHRAEPTLIDLEAADRIEELEAALKRIQATEDIAHAYDIATSALEGKP